jgi:hypothetical protein
MSKPYDIDCQIITQLKNSADLNYVNDYEIFLGVRNSMTNYPCIVVEPLNSIEMNYVYPKQKLHQKYAVVGFIHQPNADKSIEDMRKLENDVKKALSSDITLGGYAHKLEIKETAYDFVEFPVRSFSLSIDVMFEQTSTVRS